MRTIMRINNRIGTVISKICSDGEGIRRGSSNLHEYCSELMEHRGHLKAVGAVSNESNESLDR